ncbi:MAG TPA: VCBS repeat-containing protein [Actinomycetes bacterium]|nr:VCBS repeat-containing protein [Actinomycetes bacterium]
MRHAWRRRLAAFAAASLLVMAGSVAAHADVVVPPTPTSVPVAVSGDFTGDGRSDIVLTGASGWTGISLAARTSQGGFDVTHTQAPAFAAWASLPGVRIVTGKFGGNQADDIALTGVEGWTSLRVAVSNGNGSFTVSNAAAGSFPDQAAAPGAQVVSGDFNHDGRTDLALAGGDGWTTVPVAFSSGNATFTVTNGSAPDFAQHAQADDARVFGGDFDGDGRTDLVQLPGGDDLLTNDSLRLAFSNGNGTFRQATTELPDFVDRTDRKQVTAGDFNHDGRTDLAVVLPDMILVAYSRGDGTFDLARAGAAQEFLQRATRPGARIVGADYDCDGRTDLTVIPEPGSAWTTLPVAMPRGEEEFFVMNDPLPHWPQLAAAPGVKAVVGDYDADGCEDLALTGGTGWSQIPVALSNGDGSFNEQDVTSPQFAGWAAGASPVTLPPPPAETTGTLSILDTDVVSGVESSIAIGADGLGVASYYVGGGTGDHQDLRVAHCEDQACTSITTHDVDTQGDVGEFSSIKIGTDGLPLISYITYRTADPAAFTEDLKVAHCNDVTCASATITTLDAPARVNDVTALAIGGDGLGLISYQDTAASSTKMKVAHCANTACTSATRTTIDTVRPDNGENGGYQQTGIAVGNHGLGLISYYDGGGNQMLKVAACTNPDCSNSVKTVVDKSADPAHQLHGGWPSVTFGHDGLALISYNANYTASGGSDLKVAHCSDVYCTSSTKITADHGGHVGWRTSIAVGGDGLGVISEYDITNRDLKLAHCANLACSTATATTVDAFDDVGRRSSVTAGTDGLPLVSYIGPGLTADALRVVHCGNSDCTAPIVAPF